jgi:uncharacterized repeat protein (TIGR03803 family)
MRCRNVLRFLPLVVAVVLLVNPVHAQNIAPPSGAILDLNGLATPGNPPGGYTQYSVTFKATQTSTPITFALRNDPDWLFMDDLSISDLSAGGPNLFVNPGFELGPVYSSTPTGWSYANPNNAGANGAIYTGGLAHSGTNYWYDGSIGAYDFLTQVVPTTIGDTYQISLWLARYVSGGTFSDVATNGLPGVDLLVYAEGGVIVPTPTGPASSLTTLYQFGGVATDGQGPVAGLVQGSDGYFYGTTSAGGTNTFGTVFKITPQGALTTLYQFGGVATDGQGPVAGLVQGSDGYFYGTTEQSVGPQNYGTVFKISSAGTLTNLWDFFGNTQTNAEHPLAALVQGSDGSFYGTTSDGGTNAYSDGTVFKITPQGTLTTLYQFGSATTDGRFPAAGLVQGNDGYFYGTTEQGGTNIYGTVFKITPQGTLTTLWQFGNDATDGQAPNAGLVRGSDGSFYGTTTFGGKDGDGTVFKITPQGTLTTLYQFGSATTDGHYPYSGLVQGSDGYFYGTTAQGGTNTDYGTVFRISSLGMLTTLYQFGGVPTDGEQPYAGLVQGSDGYFYGTTEYGGTNGGGIVFQLVVALNPPANQISAIRLSTTNIVVSIRSVAGETYQLQFSNSMKPANWSNIAGASVTNSIGALMTLTNFGGALQPQGFYRFDVTPSGERPPN